jgi:hypothetical protein
VVIKKENKSQPSDGVARKLIGPVHFDAKKTLPIFGNLPKF